MERTEGREGLRAYGERMFPGLLFVGIPMVFAWQNTPAKKKKITVMISSFKISTHLFILIRKTTKKRE